MLTDSGINTELKNSAFLRKLYWQVIPLLREYEEIDYETMSYLDKFMLDHIDYYIMNMEEAYSSL